MLFQPPPDPYRPHDPTWRQHLYLHLHPLHQALQESLGTCSGRVLDVGCGMQPYRPMLGPGVTEYVGLDREGPLSRPTVVGNAEELPFEDQSFDCVIATQVFEHVARVERALGEATRVLKLGGRLIFSVPGVWPTHEAPHDYWRYTRHGLLDLARRHGIRVVRLRELGGFWSTIGQLVNLELYRHALVRQLVPCVNLMSVALERLGSREDLVLNWLLDGVRE